MDHLALLAATLPTPQARLWTLDCRLCALAQRFGAGFDGGARAQEPGRADMRPWKVARDQGHHGRPQAGRLQGGCRGRAWLRRRGRYFHP